MCCLINEVMYRREYYILVKVAFRENDELIGKMNLKHNAQSVFFILLR